MPEGHASELGPVLLSSIDEVIDAKLTTQKGRVLLLKACAEYLRSRAEDGSILTAKDKPMLTKIAHIMDGCSELLPPEGSDALD